MAFCFPQALLTHRSCRTDYLSYTLRFFIDPFLTAPMMMSLAASSVAFYMLLTTLFGAQPQVPGPVWLGVIVLAAAVLMQDFTTFYFHYLMHVVKPMWEVHKAHHGAEFLIPITDARTHPLQTVVSHAVSIVPAGSLVGAVVYAYGMPITDNWMIGRSVYAMLDICSFVFLRHSHIYLSYGWLERYLLSPAQHQIHHSQEEPHWDKNFGLLFSFWDRMFGTIVYSRQGDRFRLGLHGEPEGSYDSLWGIYVKPIVALARMARAGLRSRNRTATSDRPPEPAAAGGLMLDAGAD